MRRAADHFAKKARHENYRARSVYKLKEIDRKFRLLHRGFAVLDIGCAPGSWSQYVLERVGHGRVTGVDLLPSVAIADRRFRYLQADILTDDIARNLAGREKGGPTSVLFDLILSDAAPRTTGDKFSDSQHSLRLVRAVFEISEAALKSGGCVAAKVFQGEDVKDFIDIIRRSYEKVVLFKPKSSRAESKELYIIARNRGGLM
jgi:23S rRNA (uridine2552-2'-O)-methyltransferase